MAATTDRIARARLASWLSRSLGRVLRPTVERRTWKRRRIGKREEGWTKHWQPVGVSSQAALTDCSLSDPCTTADGHLSESLALSHLGPTTGRARATKVTIDPSSGGLISPLASFLFPRGTKAGKPEHTLK